MFWLLFSVSCSNTARLLVSSRVRCKVLETYHDRSHRLKNRYFFVKASMIGLPGVPSELIDTSYFDACPISVGDLTPGEYGAYTRLLSVREGPIIYFDLMTATENLLIRTSSLLVNCFPFVFVDIFFLYFRRV